MQTRGDFPLPPVLTAAGEDLQTEAPMERGGLTLTSLCVNFRATHVSSRLPCPLLSRPSGSTCQLPGSLSRGPTLPHLFPRIRSNCRSCNCFGVKGNLNRQKGVQRSSLMAASSYESKEVKLENEELVNNKEKLLVDCEDDQECVVGGIVALGKFDALHIGHRQLAIHASKAGAPFLLSFVGMAEVLGWEPRPPVVAKCDRKRILSTWAPFCGGMVPLEYQVEFSKVRYLTPRQFVEKLSQELRISGVVAGENYRFGYKAAGDAVELVKLCKEYDLKAFIVSSVMDNAQKCYNGSGRGVVSPNDKGQVSSSRVRQALSNGDMAYVNELLGRKHRLVMSVDGMCQVFNTEVAIPKLCLLNQPPVEGLYEHCELFVNEVLIGSCQVVIDTEMVRIKMKDGSSVRTLMDDCKVLSVEFG